MNDVAIVSILMRSAMFYLPLKFRGSRFYIAHRGSSFQRWIRFQLTVCSPGFSIRVFKLLSPQKHKTPDKYLIWGGWKAKGFAALFRVEVIAGHKADSALKAQDADIAPGDIAVFAI